MPEEYEKTVLSIQSHVTHGYVGNRAAMFPLQIHGFDVDAINTVNLSNHSGYPIIKGHRMNLQEYNSILDGIRENNFLPMYRYVLTGYVNNQEIIMQIKQTLSEIRELRSKNNKELTYICDPVMGDDGVMYCKMEVVHAYKEILRTADIVTPNYFEAGLLSGINVQDLESATRCANWFHENGTKSVIIKSFGPPKEGEHLQFLISEAQSDGSEPRRHTGFVDFHKGRYTGTGDCFAASLLAFLPGNPLHVAVEKAMAVCQDLILLTRAQLGDENSSIASRELKVTKAPENLLHPQTKVETKRL